MRGMAFVVRKSVILCVASELGLLPWVSFGFSRCKNMRQFSFSVSILSECGACAGTRKMYFQPVDTVNRLVDKSYELVCTKRYFEQNH